MLCVGLHHLWTGQTVSHGSLTNTIRDNFVLYSTLFRFDHRCTIGLATIITCALTKEEARPCLSPVRSVSTSTTEILAKMGELPQFSVVTTRRKDKHSLFPTETAFYRIHLRHILEA